MENLDSVWQIGIIALLLGLAVGVLAQRLLTRSGRETEELRQARDAAQQELKQYRDSVNQHFDKTSELVNDLTQDYVRVYQHLAEGAQTLGDSKTLNNLLEQQPGRVSIALDENTRTTPEVPPETVVAAAPPESIDEHAAAFDTAVPPVEARDMPADEDKPEDSGPAAANADRVDAADEPEPGTAASGEARTDAGTEDEASAAGETKPADDTAEPVLNVDALDEALDKTDDSAEATPPAEESDKSGARATTH